MGTHNRLTRTGPGEFLELIAIDPAAPAPAHPRWFALDEAATQARLAAGPAPVSWVVRTDDLERVAALASADIGTPRRLSRGSLTWTLTVAESGIAALGGLVPSFIQWDAEPHPAEAMQDAGLKLAAITLRTPDPDAVRAFLASVEIADLAQVEPAAAPAIALTFQTPDGRTVTLD